MNRVFDGRLKEYHLLNSTIMKRIMLMNALRQIAESLGYRFLAGREERLAPLTRGLPAV